MTSVFLLARSISSKIKKLFSRGQIDIPLEFKRDLKLSLSGKSILPYLGIDHLIGCPNVFLVESDGRYDTRMSIPKLLDIFSENPRRLYMLGLMKDVKEILGRPITSYGNYHAVKPIVYYCKDDEDYLVNIVTYSLKLFSPEDFKPQGPSDIIKPRQSGILYNPKRNLSSFQSRSEGKEDKNQKKKRVKIIKISFVCSHQDCERKVKQLANFIKDGHPTQLFLEFGSSTTDDFREEAQKFFETRVQPILDQQLGSSYMAQVKRVSEIQAIYNLILKP